MDCTVKLTINTLDGPQEIILGSTPGSEMSATRLKELLSKLSTKELANIISSLPKIDSIVDISKIDIKENSAGVYTPAELISTLPKRYQETLTKLNIDLNLLKSNIIISGFADSSLRTQYIKETNHIFLNLNYAYDQDNKVIAMFETALFLQDPKNYESNVKELLNPTTSNQRKDTIIRTAFKSTIPIESDDIILIKSIYDSLFLKQTGLEIGKDLTNTEDNIRDFYEKFNLNFVNTKRDLNYLPHEDVRIETLQQGDLIQISYQDKTKYEVFYDYHINGTGQIIAKTYSPGLGKTINNRILTKNVVTTRKLNPTVYSIKKAEAGLTIKFTDKLFYTKFRYIHELIKTQGIKIKDKQIKSLMGSTIFFTDESTMNITDVKEVTLAKQNLTFRSETSLHNFTNVVKLSHIYTIPNQTKILYDVVENGIAKYKEGFVIAKGTYGNLKSEMLIVLTSDESGNIISKNMLAKDVDYLIGEEPISNLVLDNLQKVVNSIYRTNSVNEFLENKNQRLLNFDYSIESINETTSFAEGDIVYDLKMQKFYKILDTTNESLIASTVVNQTPVYIEVDLNTWNNALLFSKLPTLSSFSIDYMAKNRRKIDIGQDPTKGNFINQLNVESIQIQAVLQKSNGFIYPVTAEEVNNPSLNPIYDASDTDITESYKSWLSARFNMKIKNTDPLFIYRYKNNSKSFLNDQYNTRHFHNSLPNKPQESIPFTSDQLKLIIPNLTPGSYLTFEGNKKSFIVEKVLENKVLLASYHNTNATLTNGQSIIGEKFLLDLSGLTKKVYSIFVPNWATNNIKNIEKILIPIEPKASKLGIFSQQDAPEIIIKVANYISEKYGIKINYVETGEIAAYATASEININLNRASIEEPVHELMHLILTTLKARDYETYKQIVNSVQNHPLFRQVSQIYDDEIYIDKLEETFVKLLSQTFRNKIHANGIFTTEVFDLALKETIQELFNLTADLSMVHTTNLLTQSINELMTLFGSKLLGDANDLINVNENIRMLQITQVIKTMRDNNNLIENCK